MEIARNFGISAHIHPFIRISQHTFGACDRLRSFGTATIIDTMLGSTSAWVSRMMTLAGSSTTRCQDNAQAWLGVGGADQICRSPIRVALVGVSLPSLACGHELTRPMAKQSKYSTKGWREYILNTPSMPTFDLTTTINTRYHHAFPGPRHFCPGHWALPC